MNPLPLVNLREVYQEAQGQEDNAVPITRTAPELIHMLDSETSAAKIKSIVLALNQLYFDGLIEKTPSLSTVERDTWAQQREGLRALLETGVIAVRTFYDGTMLERVKEIKDRVNSVKEEIVQHSADRDSKFRHLGGYVTLVQQYGLSVSAQPEVSIDTIVPAASDGFEPAFLAASILEDVEILPLRYSRFGRDDKKVRLPVHAPDNWTREKIEGRRVLITEGYAEVGITLGTLMRYVEFHEPEAIFVSTVVHHPTELYRLKDSLFRSSVSLPIVQTKYSPGSDSLHDVDLQRNPDFAGATA